MMNQQPDKLFREKLEGFNKPVPSGTWNKVKTRLNKKNNKSLWLKVAASIAVVAMAAFLLWDKNSPDQTQHITQNNNKPKKESFEEKKIIPSPPKERDVTHNANGVTNEPSKKADIQKVPSRKKIEPIQKATPVTVATQSEKIVVAGIEEKTTSPATEPVVEHSSVAPQAAVTELSAEELTGVTLVYTADEMAEKYLDKKALAKATSEGKKPSTLRKLLDKAYDLKNNQDPFGELRQKKNEILALNFKDEKQRSQNK